MRLRKKSWQGRLQCDYFWVDARLSRRTDAGSSVATPDGPPWQGWYLAVGACRRVGAVQRHIAIDLIHSAPRDLIQILAP